MMSVCRATCWFLVLNSTSISSPATSWARSIRATSPRCLDLNVSSACTTRAPRSSIGKPCSSSLDTKGRGGRKRQAQPTNAHASSASRASSSATTQPSPRHAPSNEEPGHAGDQAQGLSDQAQHPRPAGKEIADGRRQPVVGCDDTPPAGAAAQAQIPERAKRPCLRGVSENQGRHEALAAAHAALGQALALCVERAVGLQSSVPRRALLRGGPAAPGRVQLDLAFAIAQPRDLACAHQTSAALALAGVSPA